MSETNTQPQKKVKMGAVWIKPMKNGTGKFLSIEIELKGKKTNFIGFPNDYKQPGDNKPSYNLFLSDRQPDDANSISPTKETSKATVKNPPKQVAKAAEPVATQSDEELI